MLQKDQGSPLYYMHTQARRIDGYDGNERNLELSL